VFDAPFFGALALRLQFIPDPSRQTATVDGKTLRYNPLFIDSLSDPQLRGLLAHEVLHCAAGHCWRRDGRDFSRWNLACDKAINHHVIAAGFTLPEGAIPGEDGSAEEFYGRMAPGPQEDHPRHGSAEGDQQDEQDQQDQSQPSEDQDDQQDDEDSPQDESSDQDSEQDSEDDDGSDQDPSQDGDSEPGDDSDQDSDQDDGQGDGSAQDDNSGQSNDPDQDSGQGNGQSNQPQEDPGGCGGVMDAPEDDPGDTEEEWKVATVQAAMAAKAYGDLPGIAARLLEAYTRPPVDWRTVLADFITRTARNDYDSSHPNRRHLQRGILLPGLRSNELPEVIIAVDTSGSIGPDTLAMFAGAVSDVLAAYPTTVHVLSVDAEVHSAVEYRTEDLPIVLDNLSGGGGTDFRPAFTWADQQGITPACLIYLTDLYGSFPDIAPDYPVLWVSTTGERAPFGETLNLPQDQS